MYRKKATAKKTKKTTGRKPVGGKRAYNRMIRPVEVGSAQYNMGRAIAPYANKLISSVAGKVVPKLGEKLGALGVKSLEKIIGVGDYKVSHNTLINPGQHVPYFAASGKRRNTVCHREYIGDVSSSISFSVQKRLPINPGLGASFPWLTAVAANYEEYTIHGLVFEFKSTSADALNSTNTALGTVIMATQYNATASAFQNKQTMENYEYAQSCKPSESMIHTVECSPRETVLPELYVRGESVPSGQDARLYDLGIFTLATVGSQAVAVIGELWCSYEIEFLKPKLYGGIAGYSMASDHYQLIPAQVTSSLPYGTTPTLVAGSSIGSLVNNNKLYFPDNIVQGKYTLFYACTGASTAFTNALVPSVGTNCTLLQYHKGDTATYIATDAGNTATKQFIMLTFQINSQDGQGFNGQTWVNINTNNNFTVPGTLTSGDLWLSQIETAISS